MRTRPMPVTVAAILLALFSLMNFPGPWWTAVSGAEETPMVVIYSGIVLGIVGIVAAVGLWMVKKWS
jgi:nitrate reductase gamma subunit